MTLRTKFEQDSRTDRLRVVARELAPILRMISDEQFVAASMELDRLAQIDRDTCGFWARDSLQSHLRSILIDRYGRDGMAQVYERIRAGVVMVDVELGKIKARANAEAQMRVSR